MMAVAIANADEIAAIPGIDVLLIGTNDCAPKWASTEISAASAWQISRATDEVGRVQSLKPRYNNVRKRTSALLWAARHGLVSCGRRH